MLKLTPVRAAPAATQPGAAAALKRLIQTHTTLVEESRHLPKAPQVLLDALKSGNKVQVEEHVSGLLQRLTSYWQTLSASGRSRASLFADCLEKSIHDEALIKSHENELRPDAVTCMAQSGPASSDGAQGQVSASSLHVQFNAATRVEIRGALAMTLATGRTLLALPGIGLTEFATRHALLDTVAQWLNDTELRWALLINADQRHQDIAFAVANDSDLFIDAFSASDVQLQAISANPYLHAVRSQIDKQREDVRYVCGAGLTTDPDQRAAQIERAIAMSGLFGPAAMLERRERVLAERNMRAALPQWIKIASVTDLELLKQHMQRYDQAREALSSALNGAASAEQYADVSLRAAIANDLGYHLAPDKISVSTQRTLPITGQHYTITRTLPQLALYGLHPDDQAPGSAFLTKTRISIDGVPVGSTHPALTPAYMARTIEALNLRASFGEYQRKTYARVSNQKLMGELIGIQLAESAYAARMQGHISADDFAAIKAMTGSMPLEDGARLTVQHIRMNDNVLARLLVVRKDNAQGELERLIMFASDAPRTQLFQSFANETQLLHELVAWATIPQMRDYLLAQLQASNRPALNQTLDALTHKPHPEPDFVQLTTLQGYDTALQGLVSELVQITLSNQQAHTPDWYMKASPAQRQKLLALEDAINGAVSNYDAQPHTRVQAFDDYVHQRASEKIAQLLNVPAGTVDPDRIVITSARETLTYTQMMRNGYDDSLGFLNPAADTMATFSGPEGVDLSALTPEQVAGSVRGKWLCDAYVALIRRTLLDPASTGYGFRRQASTQITCLQMQAAALRSLLKGHIDAAQYQWLEVATDNAHRTDAESRARYPIHPLQIHIDKPFIASHLKLLDQLVIPNTKLTHVETVQGCFALLSNENRLAPLLYTPQAPDGVEFRVFGSFVASLSQPGMIDYYKDRCRINARRVLSFFLNDMKQGNANKPPVIPKESIADFAQFCFNRPIERKLRDVEDTTTGRHDMLSQLIWTTVDIVATVLTMPFPPASFVVGVGLSLRDSFKAFQALTGESPEDADALILASMLNMAGAAGDLQSGLKGFGGLLRKLGKGSNTTAQPAALKKLSRSTKSEKLYPIELEDEPFLIGKPNANGQAPVYRSLGFDNEDVYATRHYALKDDSGAWRPLGQSFSIATPPRPDAVSADRVVHISLRDLPRVTEGHANGIYLGNGTHYIEMNGRVYQVQYDASLRCWNIVDPQNPYAFFGRQPVKLDDQGQWRLIERTGLRGGGKDDLTGFTPLQAQTATSATAHSSLDEFQVPKNYQRHLARIIDMAPLDDLGAGLEEYFEVFYAEMREVLRAVKKKLYDRAQEFFEQAVVLPPRPPIPAINSPADVGSFLESIFTHSKGLVLSEAPKSIASKHLLIKHMQDLVQQRVEIIYLPHLFTDKHLRKLAKYHNKGRTIRSGSHEIKYHLEFINGGALDNTSREFDYYHLIKEAHRHGIEVRPLNSSVSYPVDGFEVATPAADSAAAKKMSNFFGHKVISADVAQDPTRRWIALLDQEVATTGEQIPGIAELQGVISVHIEDVPAGRATRISVDTGRAATNVHSAPCDFKIEFANPSMADPALPTDIASNLNSPAVAVSEKARPAATGFRWDESAGWQRIAPEQWVTDTSPTALQQSLADAAYEMPTEMREMLHELAYNRHRGLDSRYFSPDEKAVPVEEHFYELRQKLQTDSRHIIFDDLVARPTMPVLESQPGIEQFITDLYQQTDGVVVGEFHASIASKKFIIDNLPLLTQQNVKTLYMEHLMTDLHQLDLDRFFETGHMSERLLGDLRSLDRGHLTDPSKLYTFENLVLKAQQHGIEVRAIDCAASYHLKGIRLETPTTRQQMMNYFASRTIRRHQAIVGKHRWVALVGNTHCNTYKTVPGIAELEGAIGLRLDDVAPGASRGITIDVGEYSRLPLGGREGFIKSDFKIDIEVPGTIIDLTPSPTLPPEERLARPGMMLVEQKSGQPAVIVHRARDNAIYRTPVLTDAEGKVFVDRPNWAAMNLHLQPQENLDTLLRKLQRNGFNQVG